MSGLKNKILMMFDIVPASSPGDLNLKNIAESLGGEVVPEPEIEIRPEPEIKPSTDNGKNDFNDLMSQILDVTPKEEIEALMSSVSDPIVELASIGARFPFDGPEIKQPEPAISPKGISQDELHRKVLAQIMEPVSPRVARLASAIIVRKPITASTAEIRTKFPKPDLARVAFPQKEERARIIAEKVVSFYQNQPEPKIYQPPTAALPPQKRNINFINPPKKRRTGWWLSFLIIIGITAYGFTLKNEMIQGGISAFDNLQEAGESLKSFNFAEASENFDRSYEDFARASQTMNFMGAGLAGIFSDLPGFDTLTGGGAGKIKSAKDMTEAGKLIAESGKAMSQAMDSLAHTGSILNPGDKNKVKPLKIINELKDALLLSNKNFQKAKALISDIDESIIPEDKRAKFGDFKDKLPLLEEYLGNAIEYTEFLEAIVGIDQPRKYLFLFNNSSELRPTGGFPGTYGVVSFSGGGLADFFVNDVYNLDGQLKRNIIPPKQLQHITPTWGMRDSAWFIDFPASARKSMSFFSQEAGYKVDGVIALNPDIVTKILGIVGSIEMPEYGLNLTSDNFLSNIQREVEYGENRVQPKQVVVDFAPRFLEKLYSADSEKWMKIFDVMMAGLDEKDILFYFEDKGPEEFVVAEGFGGEVKRTSGDYLMVNLSNIKGSKTDVVTDSAISIDTSFEDGRAVHRVKLVRSHGGGDEEHGFYNRQNPAYVRVLVPKDAEILSISGNDQPNYRPLVNYGFDGSFEKDRDLSVFESGFSAAGFPGVDSLEESGKKGIGFWMITDPGKTKKIEFEYSVPVNSENYSFYFQKQPGLDWKNFSFSMEISGGYVITDATAGLNRIGDFYTIDELLKKDFELKMEFKK